MKKNLRIHLEKKQKINNPRHTKGLKKVKTELQMHAAGTCT